MPTVDNATIVEVDFPRLSSDASVMASHSLGLDGRDEVPTAIHPS
jgi:hypothetical protein